MALAWLRRLGGHMLRVKSLEDAMANPEEEPSTTTASPPKTDEEGAPAVQLKRELGFLQLTALGVGSILGAGVFVITGQAAALYAGPAVALSFVVSAVGCMFTALCYAEFASMIPISGSAYTYAYITLNELIAWIIGWDLMLEYLVSACTVAVGWSGYLVSLLSSAGVTVPAVICNAPPDGYLNVPAVLIMLLCTVVLCVGIRSTAWVNIVAVGVNLLVILTFVGAGATHVNLDNLSPFVPASTGTVGQYGVLGILRGAAVIFFSYIGFDSVSVLAQEAKNPQRTVPLSIFSSLALALVLYVAVSIVLCGLANYTTLNVADPIPQALKDIPELKWLRIFVQVGALSGLSSVVLTTLLGQTRIFFIIARDGLLPPLFARLSPRFNTPIGNTIVTGVVGSAIAGLLTIQALGELVSIGTLLAFAMVSVGVVVLRRRAPHLHRPFRTPCLPLVAALGILVSLAQMVMLPWETWARLAGWLGLGMLIYVFYGHLHSKAGKFSLGAASRCEEMGLPSADRAATQRPVSARAISCPTLGAVAESAKRSPLSAGHRPRTEALPSQDGRTSLSEGESAFRRESTALMTVPSLGAITCGEGDPFLRTPCAASVPASAALRPPA
eukprot:RCo016528